MRLHDPAGAPPPAPAAVVVANPPFGRLPGKGAGTLEGAFLRRILGMVEEEAAPPHESDAPADVPTAPEHL